MIDINKPMQMHFVNKTHPVGDFFVNNTASAKIIFVKPVTASQNTTNAWYRFDVNGVNLDYPNHRLSNVVPPPRKITHKIAVIEHFDRTFCLTITEHIESFGVAKYLHDFVPGKCIAIKDITFVEGEGNPPKY